LFFSDAPVGSPVLALLLEHRQILLQEGFVSCAQIVVVGGQTLFRSFHGVEGLSVVSDFEVADSHVGQAEGVGRKMLQCLLVALNGFLVLESGFVDVSKVVQRIAVAGVNLDGLLVPLDGLIKMFLPFEDDGCVVVGIGKLGVLSDGLFVALNGLGILPHVVVGNPLRVVQLVDALLKFINTILGLFEISD
jgi:hypothetical protein